MQRLHCFLVQISCERLLRPQLNIYWGKIITKYKHKTSQDITQYEINYYLKARSCIKFMDTMKV